MSWRRPVRFLLAVLTVTVSLAIAGTFLPRPFWPLAKADDATGSTHRILVLSNPIHTDIAVALDTETRSRFSFLEDSGMPLGHPNARWIVFGWGGRAFYIETPTWADLKPVPVFKGLTMDRSVMHVDVAGEIVEPSDTVTAFEIGDAEYEKLLAYIEASFTPEDGMIAAIPDTAYGPNDRFFEANGWFSAVVGCNTWTAKGLREAGLRTGWWNPLPGSLTTSLSLYN
ncbi:MAG TPA: TIGR02117 family protein [Pararhizobium sp.]|uniref:TIGR02117 family protein n=1 Tax=Pararhizobium sp. TaxID=1977563 RepID=UPI002CD4D030|nr:TIGR02117 family protein [Pararhizobium sp.]HTO31712.1 TIGR02117 family protein [Pararhizobium sp.]